jgi:YD repeat-containing protein
LTAGSYDLLNRVINVGDTAGNTLALTYDAIDRKVSQTETSSTLIAKTVSYSYNNGAGDPVDRYRLTWADGYYVNYGYDAVGHMTAAADSGGTTLATYTYDNLARRAQLQYSGTAEAKMLYSWSAENDLLTLSSTFSTASSSYNVAYTHTFPREEEDRCPGHARLTLQEHWITPFLLWLRYCRNSAGRTFTVVLGGKATSQIGSGIAQYPRDSARRHFEISAPRCRSHLDIAFRISGMKSYR